MSKPIYFFSDAHLGAPLLNDDKEREQKIIDFLHAAASENAAIYMVGDLFEFWFEYRRVIPKNNFALLAHLYQLTSSGTEIHYLTGNHDMWPGPFLQQELGVHTHTSETRAQLGEFDILVTHGDGTAASDKGYRMLKKVFQSRINIALYRLLHPDFGIPFAKRMSQVSRDKSFTADPLAQEYRDFAFQCFREGHNVVIMGHTHEARHEIYGANHYINLGDWISHYSYCEVNDEGISLRRWPSKEIYAEPVYFDTLKQNGTPASTQNMVKK